MDEVAWLVGSPYLVMIPLDRFLPGIAWDPARLVTLYQ